MNQKLERHAAKMRGELTPAGIISRRILERAASDFHTAPAAIQNTGDKRRHVVLARHLCIKELAAAGLHPVRIARIMGGMDRGTVYKALRGKG